MSRIIREPKFNPKVELKYLIDIIKEEGQILFITTDGSAKRFLSSGIIIERSLWYLIKLNDDTRRLSKTASVARMVDIAEDKQLIPIDHLRFFRSNSGRRIKEAHRSKVKATENNINKLRSSMYSYLEWFLKKLRIPGLTEEMRNWKKSIPLNAPIKKSLQQDIIIRKADSHLHDKLKNLRKSPDKIAVKEMVPFEKLMITIHGENKFSRAYYNDFSIDRNQLRGVKLNNAKQNLSGLKIDFNFQDGKVSIINSSEKTKVLFNNSTLVRNRRKMLPVGDAALSVDGLKLTITLKQF